LKKNTQFFLYINFGLEQAKLNI